MQTHLDDITKGLCCHIKAGTCCTVLVHPVAAETKLHGSSCIPWGTMRWLMVMHIMPKNQELCDELLKSTLDSAFMSAFTTLQAAMLIGSTKLVCCITELAHKEGHTHLMYACCTSCTHLSCASSTLDASPCRSSFNGRGQRNAAPCNSCKACLQNVARRCRVS